MGDGRDDELDRLRSQVRNLEQVMGRALHDLATPLTTANGFAELLLTRSDLPRDVAESLERIARSTALALDLLRGRRDEAPGGATGPFGVRRLVRDVVATRVGPTASAGRDLPTDLTAWGAPDEARTALDLLVAALVDHAAAAGQPPSSLSVRLLDGGEGTVHRLLLEVPAPFDEGLAVAAGRGETGPPDGFVDRLRRARVHLLLTGGRLWIEEVDVGAGVGALRVELPAPVQ